MKELPGVACSVIHCDFEAPGKWLIKISAEVPWSEDYKLGITQHVLGKLKEYRASGSTNPAIKTPVTWIQCQWEGVTVKWNVTPTGENTTIV